MDDIGTAVEVINYAIEEIDDHYARLHFLRAWRDGSVADGEEWDHYFKWLKATRAYKQEPVG